MVKDIRPRDGSRRQAARQPVFGSGFGFTRLSRHEALYQAAGLLRRSPTNTTAMRLIQLFHLDADELASAGVPYELLRAIERQALMRLLVCEKPPDSSCTGLPVESRVTILLLFKPAVDCDAGFFLRTCWCDSRLQVRRKKAI